MSPTRKPVIWLSEHELEVEIARLTRDITWVLNPTWREYPKDGILLQHPVTESRPVMKDRMMVLSQTYLKSLLSEYEFVQISSGRTSYVLRKTADVYELFVEDSLVVDRAKRTIYKAQCHPTNFNRLYYDLLRRMNPWYEYIPI